MSIKLATTTAVLLSLAASPLMAAPIYNIDNYGLVLQEKEKASLSPYFQANANLGKLSSIDWDGGPPLGDFSNSESKIKSGYDLQLGLNNHLGGGYSVDTALYFSGLGKAKSSHGSLAYETLVDPETGEETTIENRLDAGTSTLSVRGYGLKFAFGFPTTPKSTTSLILGVGFIKTDMKTVSAGGVKSSEKEEGGQVSVGLGYRYDFNKSISWNINAEHYLLDSETTKAKWLGLTTGLRFYFN